MQSSGPLASHDDKVDVTGTFAIRVGLCTMLWPKRFVRTIACRCRAHRKACLNAIAMPGVLSLFCMLACIILVHKYLQSICATIPCSAIVGTYNYWPLQAISIGPAQSISRNARTRRYGHSTTSIQHHRDTQTLFISLVIQVRDLPRL